MCPLLPRNAFDDFLFRALLLFRLVRVLVLSGLVFVEWEGRPEGSAQSNGSNYPPLPPPDPREKKGKYENTGPENGPKKTTELPLKKTKEKASPPPLFLSSFVVFSLDVVVVVVGFFWVPGRQFFRADRPMGF